MKTRITSAWRSNVETPFVIGPPCRKLRAPVHEAWLAEQVRPLGETANLVRDEIMNTIECWQEDGGLIKARRPKPKPGCKKANPNLVNVVTLNIERMEWRDEPAVFDLDGKPVMLDDDIPLVQVDDCFRSNTRRTLNRQFEKIGNPSRRPVRGSLLSLMFWEDIAVKIIAKRHRMLADNFAE